VPAQPEPLTSAAILADLKADAPATRGHAGMTVAVILKVIAPTALRYLLDYLASKYDIRPKVDA
jgi:hypothetical protein